MDSGERIESDKVSAELYSNPAVRDAALRILTPLSQTGVEEFIVQRGSEVIDRTNAGEAAIIQFREAAAADGPREITSTREVYLRVEKISFVPGQLWRFSDGQSKFGARILDRGFEARVRDGEEGFFSGDRLHVQLRTVQNIDQNGGISTESSVDRVLGHMQGGYF